MGAALERQWVETPVRYLEEEMLFCDTDPIKVIPGVRRCGKSSPLDLIRMTVESGGVADRGFACVNWG